MAVYAIGDLQGCYDSFRRLLDKIKFDSDHDTLWLTGDLVNRGPKSLKTLRYVYRHTDSMLSVLGNHDLSLLVSAADRRKPVAPSLRKILRAPECDELVDWLRRRPLLHYDESLDTAVVHAGIVPEWSIGDSRKRAREVERVLAGDDYAEFLKNLYGNKPDRWSGRLTGHDRLRFIVNVFTRARMIRADGRVDFRHKGPPAKAASRLQPWYRVKNRRSAGTRIVFGHWSALGWHKADNVLSIDTGCVWGRRLTAVRLDADVKQVRVNCARERR